MNFLIEFTTLTYKLKHGIALRLSQLYPGSRFGALISSHADTEGYLRGQNDVKYEFFYDMRALSENFLKEEPDYPALRAFEETMPEKSIWRIVAADRDWGHQFVKTVHLKKLYLYRMNSQDAIMRMASGYLKFFQEAISKIDAHVVLPAGSLNNMGCAILEQLCVNKGIDYLVPETARTLTYMAISPNRKSTFPHIEKAYSQMRTDNSITEDSAVVNLYNQLMAALSQDTYFDVVRIEHLRHKLPFLQFLWRLAGNVVFELRNPSLRKNKHYTASFWDSCVYNARRNKQLYTLLDPKFYGRFDKNKPYLYFPLQLTPEYSTQMRATMWINQLNVIEALAKSIPCDWQIYVKEHPATVVNRVRVPSFYREIKEYPNVRLIPTNTNTHEVIVHAQMVVTTTGTSGWEAIQRGKPLLTLSSTIFDFLGLSTCCSDFERLSVAIHDELKRSKEITPEERKMRLYCFCAALLKHGFVIENPAKIFGDQLCDGEEAVRYGALIAAAMKHYLSLK